MSRETPKTAEEAKVEFDNTPEAAEVVLDAQRKWKSDYDVLSRSRQLASEDYKFSYGDSDNNLQWPGDVLDTKGGPDSDKPIMTINKVRQNILLITNDMKKNKPAITFRPTGNGATAEGAKIWNGLARNIESRSLAQNIYDKESDNLVRMGFGFWTVKTDYVSPKSFDQEILIRGVKNPFSAMIDTNTKEPDQCDAMHGFVTEDVSRDVFDFKYPKFKGLIAELALYPQGQMTSEWVTKDIVRVCEFWRREPVHDTLVAYFTKGSAEPLILYKSELPKDLQEIALQDERTRTRPTIRYAVKWYFVVGNRLVEKKPWAGTYIPLVQIRGEECTINGRYDCKGHTRYLKDPQRMYNYFSSLSVEYASGQTKTPWLASAEAIEEHEDDWNLQNIDTKSVLVYNAISDSGETIPPPERINPPVSAPAALDGMKIASDEIMAASGQYPASLGAPSNERSAKAIMERQRQGDTATYHFIDALAIGVRKTGKLIQDLAPHIYDTKRVMQIMQESGKTLEVTIDPASEKSFEMRQQAEQQAIQRIFNPNIGEYEVIVDVGPDWGTKREEAFNAFAMLLGQAPQLIPILADLLMRNADFSGAEEAAERLYRMLPPQAAENGPSPQEQALQQRIQALTQSLQTLLQDNNKLKIEHKAKDQQKVIDAFNAITQRLKVVGEAAMSESQIKELVAQVLSESAGVDVTQAAAASEPTLEADAQGGQMQLPLNLTSPIIPQGSRVGSDGRPYGRDYSNMSNYRPV